MREVVKEIMKKDGLVWYDAIDEDAGEVRE